MLTFKEYNLLESLDDSKQHVYVIKKNGKVAYIGIGTKARTHTSLSQFKKKNGGDCKISIESSYSTKEAALKKEAELIKKYGIKAEGGKLDNEKFGNTPSDFLKKKHSDGLKGSKQSNNHKQNISKSLKGTPKTTAHAKAISDAMKG
jgi:hypothetical protein